MLEDITLYLEVTVPGAEVDQCGEHNLDALFLLR